MEIKSTHPVINTLVEYTAVGLGIAASPIQILKTANMDPKTAALASFASYCFGCFIYNAAIAGCCGSIKELSSKEICLYTGGKFCLGSFAAWGFMYAINKPLRYMIVLSIDSLAVGACVLEAAAIWSLKKYCSNECKQRTHEFLNLESGEVCDDSDSSSSSDEEEFRYPYQLEDIGKESHN